MSDSSEFGKLSRGASESLVQSFQIIGLHGYKNISLESQHAATILIAKNGSGKTTLLAALDAFLKCQFSRLKDLDFKEIQCRISSVDKIMLLKKSDVSAYSQFIPTLEIGRFAKEIQIDASILTKYLVEGYYQDENNAFNDSEIYSSIIRGVGYRRSEAILQINRLRRSYMQRYANVSVLQESLRNALIGIEVLYLPTYRRVELPLVNNDATRSRHKRTRPKLNVAEDSLFPNDIQFGLADISHRLYDLNQSVLSDSNIGYRKVSANIINDMLDGTFDNSNYSMKAIPDKEELNLFFSRLKEGRYVGPYADVVVPNLDKIYSGPDISAESSKFLRYYLTKLETVIRTTKDVELRIEEFINNCNRYLRATDPSARRPEESSLAEESTNGDEKVLRLNRANLSVSVESVATQRTIALDALSSGEKQMVSLFAKIFLYPEEKIVLIDEPELSLSIDWQRQILVDVINASLCRQIVAITHSPFVFENELDPFARSLKLEIDPIAARQVGEGDESGEVIGE